MNYATLQNKLSSREECTTFVVPVRIKISIRISNQYSSVKMAVPKIIFTRTIKLNRTQLIVFQRLFLIFINFWKSNNMLSRWSKSKATKQSIPHTSGRKFVMISNKPFHLWGKRKLILTKFTWNMSNQTMKKATSIINQSLCLLQLLKWSLTKIFLIYSFNNKRYSKSTIRISPRSNCTKVAGMDILSVKILVFFLTKIISMKDIFFKIKVNSNPIIMELISLKNLNTLVNLKTANPMAKASMLSL